MWLPLTRTMLETAEKPKGTSHVDHSPGHHDDHRPPAPARAHRRSVRAQKGTSRPAPEAVLKASRRAPGGSGGHPAPGGAAGQPVIDPAAHELVADPSRGVVERLRAGMAIVQALTTPGPAVVVFEDLHWADAESVALFERIPDMPGRRLLLGTYRPDEVTRRHPVADLLTRLERRHAVTHLRLERLGLADTSQLLESLSGQ